MSGWAAVLVIWLREWPTLTVGKGGVVSSSSPVRAARSNYSPRWADENLLRSAWESVIHPLPVDPSHRLGRYRTRPLGRGRRPRDRRASGSERDSAEEDGPEDVKVEDQLQWCYARYLYTHRERLLFAHHVDHFGGWVGKWGSLVSSHARVNLNPQQPTGSSTPPLLAFLPPLLAHCLIFSYARVLAECCCTL